MTDIACRFPVGRRYTHGGEARSLGFFRRRRATTMGGRHDQRIVPLLVALTVAGVTIRALVHGNYCLVPSTFLQPGEAATAVVSVYGVPMYRGAGTDHTSMYREAIWWYETAIFAEWAVAVAVGAGVYSTMRWWQGRGRGSPDGSPE